MTLADLERAKKVLLCLEIADTNEEMPEDVTVARFVRRIGAVIGLIIVGGMFVYGAIQFLL